MQFRKFKFTIKDKLLDHQGIHQGDIYLESLVEEKTKLTIILPKNLPKNKLEIIGIALLVLWGGVSIIQASLSGLLLIT